MASGSFRLNYNLFINAARTTLWGDGTSGSTTLFDTYQLPAAGTVSRDYPIYARAFSQQSVGIGAYQDIITVTVDY
jgi:spore coat protein U-like protein